MTKNTLASLVTIEHLQALDFWSRVDVCGPDECWEWRRARSSRGYGIVHVGGRITGFGRPITMYAHRVALSLSAGRLVAAENVVDHRCYNTVCCNPAHLESTTQLVNVRRGRKPACKATPFVRPDGTVRWQVRWYDYSGPRRRYLSRSFDSRSDAEAFAQRNRDA